MINRTGHRRPDTPRWLLLLLFLGLGACEPAQPIVVPLDEMLVLEEEFQLHALAEDPIAMVFDVDRLPDGSFLVTDPGGPNLKLFDQDGRHVRTMGRAGEGPGEFQLPMNTRLVTVGGALAIESLEMMRGTLVRYRPDGTYLGTVQLHDSQGTRVRGFLVTACGTEGRHWIAGSHIVRISGDANSFEHPEAYTTIEVAEDGEILSFMGPPALDADGEPAPTQGSACALYGDQLARVRGGLPEIRVLNVSDGSEQVLALQFPPDVFLPWSRSTYTRESPKLTRVLWAGPRQLLIKLGKQPRDAPALEAWALVDLDSGVQSVSEYMTLDHKLVGSDPETGKVYGVTHNLDGSATLLTYRLR